MNLSCQQTDLDVKDENISPKEFLHTKSEVKLPSNYMSSSTMYAKLKQGRLVWQILNNDYYINKVLQMRQGLDPVFKYAHQKYRCTLCIDPVQRD